MLTNDFENLSKATPYQLLIGSLSYLTNPVRPDMSFAVAYLLQLTYKLNEMLLKIGKYVLNYLSGTEKLAVIYRAVREATIRAYSDADWEHVDIRW